jgi:hypothetical protein
LAVLFAVLAYNYTEAAFKGVHLVWTFFHLAAMDYVVQARRSAHKRQPLEPARSRALSRARVDSERQVMPATQTRRSHADGRRPLASTGAIRNVSSQKDRP